MTAREIFKKCVYNPMPDGKEYEKELYENCLNMEMAKHISHAQIEGPEYYPKAIAKLRHKIVDEALNIHNYWSRIANDKQEIFGVSDLSTLLDWIDSKLNASDNETRGMLEKAYGRELFVFVLNMTIINRLQARLDAIGDEGASEKRNEACGATISKRGPKTRPFRELVLTGDVDKVMAELHNLISKAKSGPNGKKGKAVGIILRVAVDEGIISAPTFQEIFNEFNQYSIGSQQAITPYLRNPAKSIYNMAEAEGAKKRFEQLKQ